MHTAGFKMCSIPTALAAAVVYLSQKLQAQLIYQSVLLYLVPILRALYVQAEDSSSSQATAIHVTEEDAVMCNRIMSPAFQHSRTRIMLVAIFYSMKLPTVSQKSHHTAEQLP